MSEPTVPPMPTRCRNCNLPIALDRSSAQWFHVGAVDGKNGYYCTPQDWEKPKGVERSHAEPVRVYSTPWGVERNTFHELYTASSKEEPATPDRLTLSDVKDLPTIRQFFKKARQVAMAHVALGGSGEIYDAANEVIAYIDKTDPEAKIFDSSLPHPTEKKK